MRYYIDTHILIDLFENKKVLPKNIISILDNSENVILASSESIKESIHLFQIGKVKLNKKLTIEDFIEAIESKLFVKIVPYKKEHLLTLSKLPLYEDHRDPSDRIIIAQAVTEKVPLISNDLKFSKYKNLKLISGR